MRLQAIKKEIEDTNLLQQKKLSKRSQLHHVLGTTTNNALSLRYEALEDNAYYINIIGPLIYEAYVLTSKVLQELSIIPKVNYTFTYQGKNKFYRAQDIEIDAQKDLTYELYRGSLIVRLKQTEIKNKILANQAGKNIEWVSRHYQNFIKPLEKAQLKGKFKINYGYASEAFERHWEELQHSIEKPYEDDFGGVGHIWLLYYKSSGREPYYTGPDTALAQVKNANASIISNADTVLNTLQAVLTLVSTEVSSVEEGLRLQKQFSQAFAQRATQKQEISKNIWDAVEEDVQKMIMDELGAKSFKVLKNKVIFLK